MRRRHKSTDTNIIQMLYLNFLRAFNYNIAVKFAAALIDGIDYFYFSGSSACCLTPDGSMGLT